MDVSKKLRETLGDAIYQRVVVRMPTIINKEQAEKFDKFIEMIVREWAGYEDRIHLLKLAPGFLDNGEFRVVFTTSIGERLDSRFRYRFDTDKCNVISTEMK